MLVYVVMMMTADNELEDDIKCILFLVYIPHEDFEDLCDEDEDNNGA